MAETLEIRLFGGLQILRDSEIIDAFRSSKVPALLAYLAVTGRPHKRETLAALLWGELPDADAKNNLRQTLSNLRQTLDPFLRISRDEVEFLAPAAFFLDTEAISRLAEAGDYPAAAALYTGDFLAGFGVRDAPAFEEWVLAQQTWWREQAWQIFRRAVSFYAERGEFDQAIDAAHRLLALDPWQEEAHRQLMLLLARSGRFSAALAQYRACRTILRQEFDADPSHETTRLYERIRTAAQGPRHNLPGPVTGFVGREAELAQLRTLLAAPQVRLLTLLGPGGVGKTRLALELAAACQPLFLNGVWFVSLPGADAPDRNQFILALAAALGCPLSDAATPARQLIDFLRAKELLLVLDNLEEWREAGAWLSEMLAQAPEVKVLATSRLRLNLQAERIFRVEGLSTQTENPQEPASEAWQLFVRRARRLRANFTPSPAESAAIQRICALVEGLPLGIELAAAWVHALPCTEIAAQIEQSLDFLRSGYQDTSPRHSSLRGVFDWTWRRLRSEEQAVFRRLALFAGPFSHQAAAEVTGANGSVLAALVDHSLAWQRGDRLQLHQVARHFGLEKLQESGELARVQAAHAHYYGKLLATQGQAILGGEQAAALVAMEEAFENVRLAWRWLVQTGDVAGLAAAMDGLYHFMAIRSRFLEALELFGSARQAWPSWASADQPQARLTYYRLLAREGRFLAFLSRFAEANALFLESLVSLRALGEADEIAFVLGHLGAIARSQGDLAQAEAWLQECLALRRQRCHRAGEAVALLELGGVAFMAGDYDQARQRCQDGLAVAEAIGDRQTLAHLLTGLSLICRETHQLDLALAYGKQGEAVYAELGDRYGVIQSCLTLGELHRQSQNYGEARRYIEQAVQVSREIGHRSGEADGLHRLGQIDQDCGELSQAMAHQLAALELATELEERPLVLDALVELAHLWVAQAAPDRALLLLAWLHEHASLQSQRFQELEARLAGQPPAAQAAAQQAAHALEEADLVRPLYTWSDTAAKRRSA
ncbi:MAG: transcriptional activator [Litorilinea sp.]|nr:MAG: transcriptional activator [Litorilinea sp.]